MNQPAIVFVCLSLLSLANAEPLPLWFVEAFNDVTSGVAVSVGAQLNQSQVESISIMTKHLPLGLFGSQRHDQTGLVFLPGGLNELCSFPTNAFTLFRENIGAASNSSLTPRCGMRHGYSHGVDEWECTETPEEYGAEFEGNMGKLGGTCHFANKSAMLGAEEALLRACVVSNRTVCGNTPWNEIVVSPYSVAAVGAIFWAHSGPFREPDPLHSNIFAACSAISTYHRAGGKLPIIEFAGFDSDFYTPNMLPDWRSNMTIGGYKVDEHFRLLNASHLSKACANTDGLHVTMPVLSQSSPISFEEAVHEHGGMRSMRNIIV